MSKLFRLFFVVFASICSLVRADTNLDKYRVYVSKVDQEFHYIALSNGMICQVIQKGWGSEKFLVAGEEIVILPMFRHIKREESLKEEGDLILVSLGQKKIITVWMTEESNPQMLSYVSQSSVCIKQAGWFSSEQRQSVFKLSDGSKWRVADPAFQDAFHVFAKEGDRILISHTPSPDLWVLVNVDHLYLNDDSKETLGHYCCIWITPEQNAE